MYVNKILVVVGVLAAISAFTRQVPPAYPVAALASIAVFVVAGSYLWLGVRRAAKGLATHVRETDPP